MWCYFRLHCSIESNGFIMASSYLYVIIRCSHLFSFFMGLSFPTPAGSLIPVCLPFCFVITHAPLLHIYILGKWKLKLLQNSSQASQNVCHQMIANTVQSKEPLPTAGGNVIFVTTLEIRMEIPQNKVETKLTPFNSIIPVKTKRF